MQKKMDNPSKVKTMVVKGTERTFLSFADLFSILGCGGRIYEPKMPKALKK